MNKNPKLREAARGLGERLDERRRSVARSLADEFAESERDFEAMRVAATEPTLFERALAWLKALELPEGLLQVTPHAVRGSVGVRKLSDAEPYETSLAAETDSRVEVSFDNHHTAPVWVVACEQEPDGSVSFVPEHDLADAPQVEPGDGLTFTFTPTTATTVKVVAIALRTMPKGVPAEVLAEPSRLQEFGVVATARFTLRVSPPEK